MKTAKTAMWIILAMILFSGFAHAKYEMVLDEKVNPAVDLSKLDFSNVTIFAFDKTALCGDDVVKKMHQSLKDILLKNNIQSIFLEKVKEVNVSDEFSLDTVGDKSQENLFKNAKTDIVISGVLARAEIMTKRFIKSYAFYDIELYIYSKSAGQIIYKAHYTEGKTMLAHGRNFDDAFGAIMMPFIEKLKESKQ